MLLELVWFILGMGCGILLTITALMMFSDSLTSAILKFKPPTKDSPDPSDWWKPEGWKMEDE